VCVREREREKEREKERERESERGEIGKASFEKISKTLRNNELKANLVVA
jgi:hypothetical protein